MIAVINVISVMFPILAFAALKVFEPVWVVIFLLGLLGLRILSGRRSGTPLGLLMATIGAVIVLAALSLYDQTLAIRMYPVFMNGAFLGAFAYSLIQPPSMIERFARMGTKDLPDAAIPYTRNVTKVWCGFLALNVVISLWTALYGSMTVWTIYNGGVSYCLMGLLLLGEFLVRPNHEPSVPSTKGVGDE